MATCAKPGVEKREEIVEKHKNFGISILDFGVGPCAKSKGREFLI
jgi:hypothetical protein